MRKVLIVGGVAGGASTATRLKRMDESANIIMFEKGPYTSFANCGLPYYIGGVIPNRESLIIQTPEKIKGRFDIDVRVNSEVISVDTVNKSVVVRKSTGEEYTETYDTLVLSPGAKATVPPIPGIHSELIMTLRNIPDTDKIKNLVDSKNIKNAVVIGGGYVGVEMAENFIELGIQTTLIEAMPHVLAPFDNEMATLLEKEMVSNGLNLMTNEKVVSFEEKEGGIKISLESGKVVVGDIVVLAIGVTPDTAFIKESGINLAPRGHIIVNENLETSVKDVYALGDAILVKELISGQDVALPLAGPANRQGRIVANNIVGKTESYKGSMGTSIIKIFDLTAAGTGNNERTLKARGASYQKIYLHPNSHASYYPGATPLTIKVLFDPTSGKVLGAQALGYDGVDKFVDVIATTIKFGGTMDDLAELELAYAPPYLSAKSPANMAGFMGKNLMEGYVSEIHVEEIKEQYNEKLHQILDIRDEIELVGGSFENSLNIPLNSLRENMSKLDKNREIWVYCAVGLRGYIAARMLTQHGFTVKNISGGLKLRNGYTPVDKREITSGCSIVSDNGEVTLNRANSSNSVDSVNKVETVNKESQVKVGKTTKLDLCGLQCPGPLLSVRQKMDELESGDLLEVKASDPGFYKDIEAWATSTGNSVAHIAKEKGIISATLVKGGAKNDSSRENQVIDTNDGQTIVVFSGDLDKAIAAFIIANGAAAMGKKVTMFFTFWGLSIIKKREKVNVNKSLIEKMFGMMLPHDSFGLGLSKMNMGGMGRAMIRWIMKDKGIMSLEQLMEQAAASGIEIVACTMSMDVMGVKEEELLPFVTFGGVGHYLGEANKSNKNLFI